MQQEDEINGNFNENEWFNDRYVLDQQIVEKRCTSPVIAEPIGMWQALEKT